MDRAQRLQLLFAGDEDLLQLDTHLARPVLIPPHFSTKSYVTLYPLCCECRRILTISKLILPKR